MTGVLELDVLQESFPNYSMTSGPKGHICRELEAVLCFLYPCAVQELQVVGSAAGFGKEEVSSKPWRAAIAGTNFQAHFGIRISIFLFLPCCWESLRRHCMEQQGLPSSSLSSPAADNVE